MQTTIARLVYLERFYLAISIHKAYCDTLKAFRIAQFSKNSKIQKITVKKFFFQNFDTGFLLIGVFRVYSRSFIAKLAKTKISISSETNPTSIFYFQTMYQYQYQYLVLVLVPKVVHMYLASLAQLLYMSLCMYDVDKTMIYDFDDKDDEDEDEDV